MFFFHPVVSDPATWGILLGHSPWLTAIRGIRSKPPAWAPSQHRVCTQEFHSPVIPRSVWSYGMLSRALVGTGRGPDKRRTQRGWCSALMLDILYWMHDWVFYLLHWQCCSKMCWYRAGQGLVSGQVLFSYFADGATGPLWLGQLVTWSTWYIFQYTKMYMKWNDTFVRSLLLRRKFDLVSMRRNVHQFNLEVVDIFV